MSVFVNLKSSH